MTTRDQLRAEVEILKESLRLACEIREGTSMGEQRLLYWEQLQEKLATAETELAAALAACKSKDEAIREGLETYKIPMTARIVEALAIQPDGSALEAMIAKAGEVMREKCIMGFLIRTHWYAEKGMRALPAVTLEDLK